MKAGLVLAISMLSGTGLLAGNVTFDHIFEFTIEEVLRAQNQSILGKEQEESWLVLAQQYRENGTVQRYSERNFELQKDPGFLSEEIGEQFAKNNRGFEKDEKIAESLQQACFESLSKKYTNFLYSQVINGCTLSLPEHVRNILKLQKENGDCRFGLVKSTNFSTGGFVGEVLNDLDHDQKRNYLVALERDLMEEKGSEIFKACNSRKHTYLELSSRDGIWQVSPDGNSKTIHKLPLSREYLANLQNQRLKNNQKSTEKYSKHT